MLDCVYDIVTPSSLGLAISYYRHHCVRTALSAAADAGKVLVPFSPRSSTDPYNLPRMHPDAVKYADENPWTSNSWSTVKPRRSLLLLPAGFEDVQQGFASGSMIAKVAASSDLLQPEWFEEEWSAIVMVTSNQYVEPHHWRSAWCLILQAVSKGTEFVALPGPKDGQNWGNP